MSTDQPKKKSFWSKLVPSCGTSSKNPPTGAKPPSNVLIPPASQATSTLNCASCNSPQSFVKGQSALVCSHCHKINRIIQGDPIQLSIASDAPASETHHLVRTSSTTYHPVGSGVLPRTADPVVPQCQVCMDGPGDMVFLPCGHGAVCESCAKHIAKNLSVGGNHCVKCREEIKTLVRLSEMYPDQATGVTVIVPSDEVKKGPPKVPPPPGLNKSKDRSRN
jgi:LSD1 subclass zinc finger protein